MMRVLGVFQTRALLLCVLAAEEAPSGPEERAPPDPYPAGEVLHYSVKVRYGFLSATAGGATMSVGAPGKVDGREVDRLEMRIKSNEFTSRLYPLDTHATSTVDRESGGTVRFRSSKKERGRSELEEFTRDPAGTTVESVRVRHNGRKERRTTEVGGPVQDVLGIFFHLRRRKLELGELEQATVFQGHKAAPIVFGVDGLEELVLGDVGRFWALKLHPSSAIPGLISDEGEATIWVEETTHVMLKMAVRGRKGSATMTLVRAERSPLLDAPGASGDGG